MLGRTKRKVRYFLKDGPTIEGIEAGRTRSDFIVWAPRIFSEDQAEPVKVSDHVEIERANVLFRQVVG